MTVNWFSLIKFFAPIVLSLIPQVLKSVIPLIVEGIDMAEKSNAPGGTKKETAIAHVQEGLGLRGEQGHAMLGSVIDAIVQAANHAEKAGGTVGEGEFFAGTPAELPTHVEGQQNTDGGQ